MLVVLFLLLVFHFNTMSRLLNLSVLEGNGNFTETDLFLIFSMVSGSPHGHTTLFHFLNNHWDILKEK